MIGEGAKDRKLKEALETLAGFRKSTGGRALTVSELNAVNERITAATKDLVSAERRLAAVNTALASAREEIAALALVSGGVGDPTDLGYTAATREITSSTGTSATIPLVTSDDAGLAPASGGGTKAFLRADAAWVAPAFMTDAAVKLPAGLFTSAHTSGAALGTVLQVANRNTIAPFRPQYDMTIDQVGVSTSTGVAATTAKVVIYAADPATGLPTTLIAESADISCATSGTTVMVALSVTFEAGKTYWIGARSSGAQTLRSITSGGLPMLSLSNAGTPVVRGSLLKLETYANPAAAWGYLDSHMSNTTVPLVLMRMA